MIAPRLAAELGLPFVDRIIGPHAIEEVEPTLPGGPGSEEGLTEGEQETTPAGRFLSYFARAASVGAILPPDTTVEDDDTIRRRTEEGLRSLKEGASAVLLGRAGAVVLAGRAAAYHVRLDGPVERRLAWAEVHEHLTAEAAKRRQAETDRARTLFVKRLFRTDPADPTLYHLVVDSTAIGVDATVTLVAGAARAYFAALSA